MRRERIRFTVRWILVPLLAALPILLFFFGSEPQLQTERVEAPAEKAAHTRHRAPAPLYRPEARRWDRPRCELTLFDNWLQLDLTAGFSGIAGRASYVSDPVKIELKLVLDKAKYKRSGWKLVRYWDEVASRTLTSWSAGSMTYTFLSF